MHMHHIKLNAIFSANAKLGTGLVFMPMESYHDKTGKQQIRGGFPYIARAASGLSGIIISPLYPDQEPKTPVDITIVDASDIMVIV